MAKIVFDKSDSYIAHEAAILKEIYDKICKDYVIEPVDLVFKRLQRGSGVCNYISKCVLDIELDLRSSCIGAAYLLCHEVAHQICISKYGNATHNARFEKVEDELIKKYTRTRLANSLNF